MPQFIYTMKGLGKVHPPDAKVLEDIWLSFYFGAKIGVLGLNGAGKSSLLKIMSGEDTSFIGEAFPGEGFSIFATIDFASKAIGRQEFRSGAVVLRYEPQRR